MTQNKTSVLVEQQVPEFIREEHPKFVQFLQAYYEFLETVQGTQKNDLITKAKELRDISDVDASLNLFEETFFNSLASLFPRDVAVNKAFLIKKVLPVYLAKGNEKAFEFLFRLLYDEEITITYPKDNILRASDGKWTVENIIRLVTNIRTTYTGTGSKTTFYLPQEVNKDEITVTINGSETSSFQVRKEARKIIFDSAPASNASIIITYDDFDINNLVNRKLTGNTSGATALVERASAGRIITQPTYDLYFNDKTLVGDFELAEDIISDIIAIDGNTIIDVKGTTVSSLNAIRIVDGGSLYNIGDIIPINGGGYSQQAEAVVSSVTTGYIDTIRVLYGGAGFQVGGLIRSSNGSGVITAASDNVVTHGANSANTFTVFTDVISSYANVTLTSSDYGFPANVIPAGENISTRIVDALSTRTITGLGEIANAVILFANSSSISTAMDAEGALFETSANTFFDIKNFGALGRIQLNNRGLNYQVGDEIVFGANPVGTYGVGAAAAVTSINTAGSIIKVEFQPSRIAGTANIEAGNNIVIGTGTSFTDLAVNDQIMVNNESKYVNTIISSTLLTTNTNFTATANNKKVGVYGRHLIGGQGYTQNNFPTLTVSSSTGSGASLQVISIMGDSEQVSLNVGTVVGQILAVSITNPGIGYQYVPSIDLTSLGDGTAIAEAVLESSTSYIKLPGRWAGSDGLLSTQEVRVQGVDYYIDYSYVISSAVEFKKYKEIFRQLVHPVGFARYAEYDLIKQIPANTTVTIYTPNTISGLVNVGAGLITITGINTKFNVANTRSILTIGSTISVNNQIRYVNNIISNTQVTVNTAFTTTSNLQSLVIIA